MNEKKALNLVEEFPGWIAGQMPRGDKSNAGLYLWGAIKAQVSVSKIQWFVHVLYQRGYEIRKKEESPSAEMKEAWDKIKPNKGG